MTQSRGMTDSEQNFRKNNTGQARQMNHAGQASFEIEHIIIDGAPAGASRYLSGCNPCYFISFSPRHPRCQKPPQTAAVAAPLT
jgi:hypothetical protein